MYIHYAYLIFVLRDPASQSYLITTVTCDTAKNTMTVPYADTLITHYMLFNNNNNNSNNNNNKNCNSASQSYVNDNCDV